MIYKSSEDQLFNTITPYQSFALIVSTIYGIGILTLPRTLAKSVGNDAVWVLLIAGILVWVLIYLNTRLIQRFPKQTIVQFVPRILGSKRKKWIGLGLASPIFLVLAVAWMSGVSLETRMFAEAMNTGVLQRTPLEVIIGVLLLTATIAAGAKPSVIARFNELLLPLSFIPFLLIFFAVFQRGEMTNLLPLFHQISWSTLWKSVLTAAYTFVGYEVILIFSAFYRKPDQALKYHSTALGVVLFIYWGFLVAALGIFTSNEVQHILWPGLEVVRVIESPTLIIEGLESGVLSLWVITVFTAIVNIYVALVQLIIQLFKIPDRHTWKVVGGLGVIAFLLAKWPENIQMLLLLTHWYGFFSLIITFLIPILLLGISIIRKLKGGSEHGSQASSSSM
ncbi:GerAB/ArcD/ProY family transporter [Hazenella coriacea]|uniref:Spore germination protein n=1 Tax=Hazenella coriacea TaxID=1179467 RepID=A0A4V6NZ74_9BACL|nr:endospore germination permease [Hazenella coriacea]TCS93077.1 spore germination protein [Hazenella coriacea]